MNFIFALCLLAASAQAAEPPTTPPPQAGLERQWLQAVAAGHSDEAIRLALALLKNAPPPAEPQLQRYGAFFQNNKIMPEFLQTPPFDIWDFHRWKEAAAMSAKAKAMAPDGKIETLFRAVANALSPGDPAKDADLWPSSVLDAKVGMCDRQAWVFCELAWQLGADTQIIYLIDEGTGKSPHTICEVRKGGRSWICDPFSKTILADTTLAELKSKPELATRLWTNRPEWVDALRKAFYLTPAYPQDYRPGNQRLAEILHAALGADAPAFGAEPYARGEAFSVGEDTAAIRVGLWHFPLLVLARQMRRAGLPAAEPAPPP